LKAHWRLGYYAPSENDPDKSTGNRFLWSRLH
jgi:hypothetical protein